MEESYERGFEELKIISEIIGRLENTINSRQNWIVTIVTGLVLALINGKISSCLFLSSSCFVIIIFIILELSLRLPVSRAVNRSYKIQNDLLKSQKYNGPNYDLSGQNSNVFKELRDIVSRFRFWGFYAGLIIFILILFFYQQR